VEAKPTENRDVQNVMHIAGDNDSTNCYSTQHGQHWRVH